MLYIRVVAPTDEPVLSALNRMWARIRAEHQDVPEVVLDITPGRSSQRRLAGSARDRTQPEGRRPHPDRPRGALLQATCTTRRTAGLARKSGGPRGAITPAGSGQPPSSSAST